MKQTSIIYFRKSPCLERIAQKHSLGGHSMKTPGYQNPRLSIRQEKNTGKVINMKYINNLASLKVLAEHFDVNDRNTTEKFCSSFEDDKVKNVAEMKTHCINASD